MLRSVGSGRMPFEHSAATFPGVSWPSSVVKSIIRIASLSACTFDSRSIKRESKVQALKLAIRMMDLTTLEGQDTPGKVAALCSKGMRPDPTDLSIQPVAAVCVYPNLVVTA